MNSLRPPWTAIFVIAMIAFLGCFLRVCIAASDALWLDELHTSWSVNRSLGDVARHAADGNQPPLYFWLTWGFISVFGHSEFSLRFISIISGIGTLLVASRFTWKWTGSAIAATLVAWIIAVNARFVYYGSEARPYALLQLLSVIQVSLCFGTFFRRETIAEPVSEANPDRSVWPHGSLAISTIILVNIHPTSVWLIVAEMMFLVIVWRSKTRGHLGSTALRPRHEGASSRLISTAIVVAAGCLPLLIQTKSIFNRRGNWEIISSIMELWTQSWPVMVSLIGLPMFFLVFSRIRARKFSSPKGPSNDWRMVFVLLWAIVPIGCVVGLDFFQVAPVALGRYTLVGAAGFPIFAGFCLGCLGTKLEKAVLAGLIVVVTTWQNPVFESLASDRQIPQFRFEDWETPISEINRKGSKSRHPVFVFANLIEDQDALRNPDNQFQNYLLFPVSGLYQLGRENRQVSAGPTLEFTHFSDGQIESIKAQGGAWAIIRSNLALVYEIGDEVRARTAMSIGKRADEVEVSILKDKTPDNPVYLMSVDW